KEQACEVHIDDAPPHALREVEQRRQLDHGRRVDEDVDRAEPLDGPRDGRLHVGRLGHVAADRLDGAAALPKPGRCGGARGALEAERRQAAPLGAEPPGAPQPHALAAPDDQPGLPAEPAHHTSWLAETRIFTWPPPGSARRSMPRRTTSRIPIRLVTTRS